MSTTGALAVFGQTGVKWRVAMNGWVSAKNPGFKAEYAASDRPWRVIHTLWIEHRGHLRTSHMGAAEWADYIGAHGPPRLCDRAVAKVHDPRLDQWVYRRMGRVAKGGEWVFLKPQVFPAHFESLDAARGAFFFDENEATRGPYNQTTRPKRAHETKYWVRDDDEPAANRKRGQ